MASNDELINTSLKTASDGLVTKREGARAHLLLHGATPPTDLETGQPATHPPSGSNVITPGTSIPPSSHRPDTSRIGARNEGIYPEK